MNVIYVMWYLIINTRPWGAPHMFKEDAGVTPLWSLTTVRHHTLCLVHIKPAWLKQKKFNGILCSGAKQGQHCDTGAEVEVKMSSSVDPYNLYLGLLWYDDLIVLLTCHFNLSRG